MVQSTAAKRPPKAISPPHNVVARLVSLSAESDAMKRSISVLTSGVLLAGIVGCQNPAPSMYQTRAWEGVTYVERGKTALKMDIVAPVGMKGPRPAVIMVHGGAWTFGGRQWMRASADFLASMGFVSAAIDYRLTPTGAKYPDQVRDCLAAVKFLRSHAGDYGINPDRIAIGGDSAGGHLSLLVGLTRDTSIYGDDSYPGVSTDVCAIVDIYGPTDMLSLYKTCPWMVRPDIERFIGGTPATAPDKWREASPMTHVRGDAPPVLILHGDGDAIVNYKQAEDLEKAIRAAGGTCQLIRVRGGTHGWCLFFTDNDSLRTLPSLVRFLCDTLER